MVTLNRAVAVAMVDGPDAGLELVDTLSDDARMSTWHHYQSTRAHLPEMAGDYDEALDAHRDAARRATTWSNAVISSTAPHACTGSNHSRVDRWIRANSRPLR